MRRALAAVLGAAVLGAAVLGAAVLAVGCGGDGGPSKAEFVSKAGAICERSKARADRIARRTLAAADQRRPTAAQTRRLLLATLPVIRDSGERIAELEPPAGDADRIAAYLAAYRRAADEMERIAADPERTGALMSGRLEDPFARADAMAGRYGIERCSGDEA